LNSMSRLVIVVTLFLSGWIGACGGKPPIKSQNRHKHIQHLWVESGAGWLQLSEDTQKLPEKSFPIKLLVSQMDGDSGLPQPDSADTYTLTKSALSKPIKLKKVPREAGFVLISSENIVLDQFTYVDFPKDALLLRTDKKEDFCQLQKWKSSKKCTPTKRNPAPKRLRQIRSAEDFDQLATKNGRMGLRTESVKFIIDLERDELTHFFHSKYWSLHYGFVRENIEKLKRLDQCIPEEKDEFNKGWYAFSEVNYFQVKGRRYLLGTIMHYPGSKLYSVEFSSGDTINGEQMARAYAIIRESFDTRLPLAIRPTTEIQTEALKALKGYRPKVMDSDAPYKGETEQLLSPGLAYGVLKVYTNAQLLSAPLGIRVIALLKEVPNDINFVGGLISSQFQSSLSHINVLSRNRGTPHLVLKDAENSKKLSGLINKLVRLEVTTGGYSIKAADPKEAEAFWKAQSAQRQPFTPKRDLSIKGIVDLKTAQIKDSTSIGAKAANLAELARVQLKLVNHIEACRAFENEKVRTPDKPFAIPFYWYVDHLNRAGLLKTIEDLHKDKRFLSDNTYRKEKLLALQKSILSATVNPKLLTLLESEIKSRYGTVKVRFRSSTNVEDLANFNGAGLYTSTSVRLNDPKRTIAKGLRTVWASLWRERAWNERDFYKVDQLQTAMGILVHPSFSGEKANGVAVSTNVYDTTGSTFDSFITVQRGEVSIVNPETNITPDQFLIRWYEEPRLLYFSRSPLNHGKPVLTRTESIRLGCSMRAIRNHFAPELAEGNKPFAMESEFKIHGSDRKLYIKQARPYVFGESAPPKPTCQ